MANRQILLHRPESGDAETDDGKVVRMSMTFEEEMNSWSMTGEEAERAVRKYRELRHLFRADRILAEELIRLKWTVRDLATQQKSHPVKLALAAKLRQETTLSVKQIAERLHLGKPKGARTNLHKFMNNLQPGSVQLDWISNEQ
jgi:hypothetical protein